jgi:preprotein translocase subunit SecF
MSIPRFFVSISLSQLLSCNVLLEKTGESGANAQEHNDPEQRHEESQRQTARKHQNVNEQNIDDDRSEQRQREWDVAINQEQDRRNDLEQKYRDQIMGDKERPDELASRSRRRRAGNEVEEAVESEDQEDKAEQETGDDRSNFHGNILCLI